MRSISNAAQHHHGILEAGQRGAQLVEVFVAVGGEESTSGRSTAPRPEGDGACRRLMAARFRALHRQNGRLFVLTLGQKLCRPGHGSLPDKMALAGINSRPDSLPGPAAGVSFPLPNDQLLCIWIIFILSYSARFESAHPRDRRRRGDRLCLPPSSGICCSGSGSRCTGYSRPCRRGQRATRRMGFAGRTVPLGVMNLCPPKHASAECRPCRVRKVQVHPAAGSTAEWYSRPERQPRYALGLDTAGFFRLHPQVNPKVPPSLPPAFPVDFPPPAGWCAAGRDDCLLPLGNNDSR